MKDDHGHQLARLQNYVVELQRDLAEAREATQIAKAVCARMIAKLEGDLAEARAQLHEMRQGAEALVADRQRLERELAEARAELREALQKYGGHHQDCTSLRGGGTTPCSCGFVEALHL